MKTIELNPYTAGFSGYFRYWLGSIPSDGERQIARWKGVANRFKGKLVEVIKDVDGRFDDYSRQFLLHWGFELVENDLKWFIFCSYKNELLSVKQINCYKKQKIDLITVVEKKKLLNIRNIIKKF